MLEDSIGGDRDSSRSIGSDGGALWFGSSVLSRVGSPIAKSSLELFESSFLLTSILGSS